MSINNVEMSIRSIYQALRTKLVSPDCFDKEHCDHGYWQDLSQDGLLDFLRGKQFTVNHFGNLFQVTVTDKIDYRAVEVVNAFIWSKYIDHGQYEDGLKLSPNWEYYKSSDTSDVKQALNSFFRTGCQASILNFLLVKNPKTGGFYPLTKILYKEVDDAGVLTTQDTALLRAQIRNWAIQ